MEPNPDPPEYIKDLLQNKHFMENIRAYNQMFAMTSFGAKVDDSINRGRGPYVFKVFGQVYHWIGSLCPPAGEPPRFLQLYIYDTKHEVENRMWHFGGIDDSNLDSKIVEGLIHFLDVHDELIMTSSEQSNDVSQSETEITSDSNVIPYSQYLSEAQQETIQNPNSSAQQDVLILSMFDQLSTQVTHCTT
ncbi:hypothetical protein Tco_0483600, partial [Tanacetum coccineum]